jgi:DNA-binding SARP family transcriptional activator/tetratricopeptide (TPR) repeat protein
MWSPCGDDTFPPSPSCPVLVLSSIWVASTDQFVIELRVLGTLALHSLNGGDPVTGVTQPKRLALLLYLALAEPSGPQSRESLMALLWPEADDESTRHSLRNAVYGLRQALGDGAILSRGEGYIELDPAAIRCDAVEVRGLLAAEQWKDALARWRGDLAPGFHVSGAPEFERWLDEQRATFRRAVADAGWRRVDEMERGGEAGVGEAARRAWAIDPTNEAGARRLMQLLDATTGRAAALRAYDDLVDYLRREYDAAPSAETQAVADRLTARLQSPAPPSVPVAAMPAMGTAPSSASPHYYVPAPVLRRRPLSKRGVRIGAAILMAAAGSALVLRHAASARSTLDPAAQAGALRLPAKYRQDTSAYNSYLRGISLRFQGAHLAARDTFTALVDRAPQYAPGFAGLAHSYAFFVVDGRTPPPDGWPKAEAAARRAIALDSASASAYLALGAVEMFWHWDLPVAGKLIDRGLALDPGDPEAHAMRGTWFRWRGELDSALAEARKAHELDPLSVWLSNRVARHLYFLRRYDEAEALYRRNLRDYPGRNVYGGLADVYRAEGRMREALEMMRVELAGDSAAAARIPVATSDTQAGRMLADMSRRRLQGVVDAARRGEPVTASSWAFAYAGVGDADGTIRWIDSMRVGRDPAVHLVPIDPLFDFVRNDPRYLAWEAKLPGRYAHR